MGQRKSATQRLVEAHPWCCFCGGSVAATTLDHQPPAILFPSKDRPRGMEFPACSQCNQQTRHDEALVALLARITGEARFPEGSNDPALEKVVRAVRTGFPSIASEIFKRRFQMKGQLLTPLPTVDMGHPQVRLSLSRVAAKLALATYYQHNEEIAPESVRINTFADHNRRSPENTARVQTIISSMPHEQYLKQGIKDTQDTFFIRYQMEGARFLMCAVLHQSISLMVTIVDRDEPNQNPDWAHVWRPVAGRGLQISS